MRGRKRGKKSDHGLGIVGMAIERRRCAPPAGPAKEQVGADPCDLVQAGAPIGHDPIGVVMRRIAHRLIDRAVQRLFGDIAGAAPGGVARLPAIERSIASEGELTPGRSIRALEHHAAHGFRKGGMAQTIEDDLRNRLLADGVVARFVDLGRGEAIDRALLIRGRAAHAERPGRGIGTVRERDRLVIGPRLIGREVDKPKRLHRRKLCRRYDMLAGHALRGDLGGRRREDQDRQRHRDRDERDHHQQRPHARARAQRFRRAQRVDQRLLHLSGLKPREGSPAPTDTARRYRS